MGMQWQGTSVGGNSNPSRQFTCGYCGNPLASNVGFYAYPTSDQGQVIANHIPARIYVCHHCNGPTYFGPHGQQVPGPAFGGRVNHIPSEEVATLYDQARDCMKVNAFTAAVMCCRKLLMNVAVSEGAEEGKSFAHYVRYLADEGHIPPKAAAWVDYIRDKGNEANHEIQIMGREDAGTPYQVQRNAATDYVRIPG